MRALDPCMPRAVSAIALAAALGLVFWAGLVTAATDRPSRSQPVDPATRVDHDGQAIAEPKEREKNLYGHQFREAIVEPLSHAFDIPDKIFWLIRQMGGE